MTHDTAADGEGEEAEEPFILLSPCSISNHQAGLGEMWMKKVRNGLHENHLVFTYNWFGKK